MIYIYTLYLLISRVIHSFLLSNQEMKKAVDSIHYEIEYVLRPKTAPFRFSPQKLYHQPVEITIVTRSKGGR